MARGGTQGGSTGSIGAILVATTLVAAALAVGGAGAVDAAPDTGAVDAGDARVADPPPDAILIRDERTYFLGQTLFTDIYEPGDRVSMMRDNGSFVSELPVGENGTVVVESSRYGPGRYFLANQEGDRVDFRLVHQSYVVAAADDSVPNGGPDTDTIVTVTSNRDGYTHVVTAPGFSPGELDDAFDAGLVTDFDGDGTEEFVIGEGTTNHAFTLDLAGVTPGNYTFTFRVPDTGVSQRIDVEVEIYPRGSARILSASDPLRVQQADSQSIRGTSSLPDGTGLTITVRNVGGQAFRRSRLVRVDDGSFLATFDFSGVPVGQTFNVTVSQGPIERDTARGIVVRRAAISATDVESEGGSVAVDEVYLPDGGFVVVTDLSGAILGATGYLAPGAHEDVGVALEERLPGGTSEVVVRIHRDTDEDRSFGYSGGDRDGPYRIAGTAVSKIVRVTVATPTRTRTGTPTGTATLTPTVTPTGTTAGTATGTPTGTTTGTATRTGTDTPTTATTDDSPTTDGGGGPGFGIAVAVLSVVVALLVARRRR